MHKQTMNSIEKKVISGTFIVVAAASLALMMLLIFSIRTHVPSGSFQARGGVIDLRGMVDHQLGRAHLGIAAGDRELDALVLTDRTPENPTFLGLLGGALDEPFGIPDAFCRDQDAFGLHA